MRAGWGSCTSGSNFSLFGAQDDKELDRGSKESGNNSREFRFSLGLLSKCIKLDPFESVCVWGGVSVKPSSCKILA